MKFNSSKDPLFSYVIYGIIVFLIGITVWDYTTKQEPSFFLFYLINIAVIGLLLWIYHGTFYELNGTYLAYRSGPLRGKIKIESIKEIVIGETLWVGYRPATSRKGLIIKYETYSDIYISPNTNELFIEKILTLNPNIKIVRND